MGSAFYIIYAVRNYGASPEQAGFLTTVLMATQILANPITGWLGDRISHLFAMQFSAVAMGLSALLALFVPGADWFYPVFILNGIGNVGMWTSAMSMTLEFGDDRSRPAYIGLSNSLLAPATILLPILGGWLADTAGYSVTFGLSVFGAIAAAFLLGLLLQSRALVPQPRKAAE
jgi:MFS family permease